MGEYADIEIDRQMRASFGIGYTPPRTPDKLSCSCGQRFKNVSSVAQHLRDTGHEARNPSPPTAPQRTRKPPMTDDEIIDDLCKAVAHLRHAFMRHNIELPTSIGLTSDALRVVRRLRSNMIITDYRNDEWIFSIMGVKFVEETP